MPPAPPDTPSTPPAPAPAANAPEGPITDPDALLARLAALGIENRTHSHPALHTVEEAQAWRRAASAEAPDALAGGHCKNLFLKDKKGRLYLLVALEEDPVRIQQVAKAIGAARLSFGKPDLMEATLGVTPGSVTPFALINDRERAVTVVLSSAMLAQPLLHFHPLTNTRTTAITPAGLNRFIEACGHTPVPLNLSDLGSADDREDTS